MAAVPGEAAGHPLVTPPRPPMARPAVSCAARTSRPPHLWDHRAGGVVRAAEGRPELSALGQLLRTRW